MTLILERKVQEVTQEFLRKKYRKKAKGNRIFSQIEVRTKKKYGSKRADGFLAFRHWIWGEYVVSIEAKSRKTLPAIRPYLDHFLLFKNSARAGVTFCILSGAFFFLYKNPDGVFQYLIPLYAFMISGLIYALVTWKSYRHKTIDVLDQLKQYPGNEQWLAFSKDSFEYLKKEDQKKLRKICDSKGIGLIIVGKRVSVLEKPKWKWGSGFLKYYAKEMEVKKFLKLK